MGSVVVGIVVPACWSLSIGVKELSTLMISLFKLPFQ